MKKILIFLALSLLIISTIVEAREFETFFGLDNNFVQLMDLEVEQGLLVWKDRIDIGIVPMRIGWGVMNNMEVGLKLPYVFIQNGDNSFGDLTLYQKFKFIEESTKSPVISGGFEIDLPTGSISGSEYTSKKLDIKLALAGGKDFPDFRLYGSFGVNFLNAGDETALDYTAGVNLILSKVLKFATELYGKKYSSNSYGWTSQNYAVPGIIYKTDNNLNIKLAVPIGLTKKSYDYGVNISLNHSF